MEQLFQKEQEQEHIIYNTNTQWTKTSSPLILLSTPCSAPSPGSLSSKATSKLMWLNCKSQLISSLS